MKLLYLGFYYNTMATQPAFQDTVQHVSGDTGSGDIFHGGDDTVEAPTSLEQMGHETIRHHKERSHVLHETDAEILVDEGADLPHATHAGHVDLPGARE